MTEITITQEEWNDETFVTAFVGAYAFWTQFQSLASGRELPIDEKLRATGEAVLRGLAGLAAERRPIGPQTEEEREAFNYCGYRFMNPNNN